MSDIEIITETEHNNKWTFEVRVFDGGRTHDFDVSLGFADYDLWSHGRVAPEKVVHAAFTFLLKNEPVSAIMKKFDCSVIRRYFPHVDKELPKMV